MSREYDYDERDWQQPEVVDARNARAVGRSGGVTDMDDRTLGRPKGRRSRERSERTKDREPIRPRYDLSDRERAVLRDIGSFRTMTADDLLKHRYEGKASAMRRELLGLQQRGLLQRRSISVGKNRNTLIVVALTRQGARIARADDKLPANQAVYDGFVKPAEVPHDAAIYQMYQAEALHLEKRGAKIQRVVLDYELKKEAYSQLVPEQDSGALQYARRKQEIADEIGLPIVDGKIVFPDLRIEYEDLQGREEHIDLELATEHYRSGQMAVKSRAGFKMYGFISTSRGRRAQWEGRELTATVLGL